MSTAGRMFGKALPLLQAKGDSIDKEFAEITIEGIFNKIYARGEKLDLKTRELCTIALLTSLGRPEELNYHIVVALNLGWSFVHLREVMMLCAIPGGWPASLEAIDKLYRWFKEHDMPVPPGGELRQKYGETDWYKAGYDKGLALFGAATWRRYLENVSFLDPDFADFVVAEMYGKLLTRSLLDDRTKELCMVAGFAALKSKENLDMHIIGALNSGATSDEVEEVLFQAGIYAGQDAVSHAVRVYRKLTGYHQHAPEK